MDHWANKIKQDFPIFNSNDIIYLDNAATTQKPITVLEAVNSFYKETNANVHRAIYSMGNEATRRFEEAREIIGSFINSNSSRRLFLLEVLLMRSTY